MASSVMEATDKLLGPGEKRKSAENGIWRDDEKMSSPSEKAAYFDMLRLWVNQTVLQQTASQCFPYYLMASTNQSIPGLSSASQPLVANGTTTSHGAQREEAPGVGYEYFIAPIWKRFVAESIDVVIIFLFKLLLTFAIVDILNIDLGTALDLDTLKTSIEDDYSQIFNIASELIVLELVTKVMVCVYETLWTMGGTINMGGATPGKLVMGIRILFVEKVVVLDPPQPPGVNYLNNRVKAVLYPARSPGWKRAFFRAFIKNATVIIPIIYPVYFFTFMFRNNRMGYDVITKTIVVEENQVPVMRRL